MEGQHTRPALFSKQRGKYGRCDYNRFDSNVLRHMRAGHGSIGKVKIECRFLFTESRWGVIGELKKPAGIIYLDLDFSQPPDCKLESATITVTLAEDDGDGVRVERHFDYPVQFTDHYGPKCLRGRESLVQRRKVKNFTPSVQALGSGAGGIGLDKEEVVQTTERWDFSGFISQTKDSDVYNQLRWQLKENSLELQPTHNNVFRTAFALQHNATRFYMTVRVSGKLARFSNRLKNRLRFGEDGSRGQVVTRIEWPEGYFCPLRLDSIAQDLHLAMECANMANVPVEVPSASAASYQPVLTSQAPPPAFPAPSEPLDLQTAHQHQHQHQQSLGPRLASTLPPSHEEGETIAHPLQHLPAVTIDDLRMAATGIAHDPPRPRRPPPISTSKPAGTETMDVSRTASSVTLVNSSVTAQVGDEKTGDCVSDTCQKDAQGISGPAGKGNANQLLLGVTAALLQWFGTVGVLLWGLTGVMGLPSLPLRRKPPSTDEKSRQDLRRQRRGKADRRRSKHKAVEFDGASDSSRVKEPGARLIYPVRGRFRGHRAQRPYMTIPVGKRRGSG